jgi:1-acyl-sn-glycerol-3-phosphate acyltransferase
MSAGVGALPRLELGRDGRRSRWRRGARALGSFFGLWLAARFGARRLDARARQRLSAELAVRALAALDVEIIRRHAHRRLDGPALVVANHVSWLDVYVLNAGAPARFVAKSETRGWPVVGTIASTFDSIFIVRGSFRDAARVAREVGAALRNGDRVVVFPEATTTDGSELRRFHHAMFQAAVDAGVPVEPVALSYLDEHGRRSEAAPFVDDMTFGESLLRVLAAPCVRAELVFGEPISVAGRTRREVARLAHAAIAQALALPRSAIADQAGPAAVDPRWRPAPVRLAS